MNKRTLFSVLPVLALGGVVSAQSQTEHPVDQFRRIPVSRVGHIPLSAPPVERSSLADIEIALSSARARRIGALDSPIDLVFGAITDVDFDELGRTFILDARNGNVKIFDSADSLIQVVGRLGSGPGEFRAAKALAITAQGVLFVADAPRRVHIFSDGADGFRYVRSAAIPMDPVDMCVMGEGLYMQGMSMTDSVVLHAFNLQVQPQRSFGVVYRSGEAVIDYQAGQGRLACVPSSDLLIMTPLSLLGEIRAYSADGTPRWVTRVDGMRPIGYSSNGNSFTATVPEDGYHRFRAIVPDGNGHVWIQISEETAAGRRAFREYDKLYTLLVDVTSGSGFVASHSAPLLLRARASMTASCTEDPFPQVIIARQRVER